MWPDREKLALKVGKVCPVDDILADAEPVRGQRGVVRIRLCRSGVNSVPGGTIGLGAESQRKSAPSAPRRRARLGHEQVVAGGQV